MSTLETNSSLDYWEMSNMDITQNMTITHSSGWWEADMLRNCDCDDCDCQNCDCQNCDCQSDCGKKRKKPKR